MLFLCILVHEALKLETMLSLVTIAHCTPPPQGPNSFNFMHFLVKLGKIVWWCPPPHLTTWIRHCKYRII